MARPRKDQSIDSKEEVRSRSKDTAKLQRRKRGPVGGGLKLEFTQYKNDPNYFYYAATDQAGNLDKYLEYGFDFVLDSSGNKVTADGGGGLTHYLMKQHMEHRKEDLELAENDVRLRLEAESGLGRGEYIPGGGKEVIKERLIQ